MTDALPLYEKLGSFYLGRLYDPVARAPGEGTVLYDARDLTTHAVCVGMTGSGKTGLGISLLEEAAIDGIPVIAIDPKGDLGNLMLTFPDLRPEDFRPWIDEGEAARRNLTPDAWAEATAKQWREGLAAWDQDGARIARFAGAAERTIYTPGSTAGLPLSILRSFAAPPAAQRDDAEARQDRVTAAVSGLLGLLGVDADPLQSREHILLATILDRKWQAGEDLDMADLIREVQQPSFDRVGVMDLESFYPSHDRAALAMRINNLLASPGFAAWMEGEPLDIQRLLWTPEGRPRISIISIAHLTDAERMFFVTLLLNEVVAWMRGQAGTASLRALLYMDEIFGYFPPSAVPPSKLPMLTMLKQARAYGVGVVLATQNPVDLDYKGLSNTGTWFIGRLQTERDKLRVLDGLESAGAGGMDRAAFDRILSGLDKRVFLMHNVHEDAPALLHTRWALSYLRGPLTRREIETLMADREVRPPAREASPASLEATAEAPDRGGERPPLPAEVRQRFVAPADGATGPIRYQPALMGEADLHFVDRKSDVDCWEHRLRLVPLEGRVPADVWEPGEDLPGAALTLADLPAGGADFGSLPAAALRAASYGTWAKKLQTWMYQNGEITLLEAPDVKMASAAGESEGDFRVRVREAGRERRDGEVEKLRARYAPKVRRLEDQIRRARQKVDREESQFRQASTQSAISVGATVLGALFGRKVTSVGNIGRATTAMRGVSRAGREKGDIARAREELAALETRLQELDAEARAAVADVEEAGEARIEPRPVSPRKSDIAASVTLLWLPWRVGAEGSQPAWHSRATRVTEGVASSR